MRIRERLLQKGLGRQALVLLAFPPAALGLLLLLGPMQTRLLALVRRSWLYYAWLGFSGLVAGLLPVLLQGREGRRFDPLALACWGSGAVLVIVFACLPLLSGSVPAVVLLVLTLALGFVLPSALTGRLHGWRRWALPIGVAALLALGWGYGRLSSLWMMETVTGPMPFFRRAEGAVALLLLPLCGALTLGPVALTKTERRLSLALSLPLALLAAYCIATQSGILYLQSAATAAARRLLRLSDGAVYALELISGAYLALALRTPRASREKEDV